MGFVSLGCPKNLVDSEVMMGLLARAGAELTRRAEDADVIVVNTCSFIESAQQESVNTILEMAAHKTGGKAKKLVVAGCLVERFRDQIRKDIPEVDAVVGTGELENILAAAGLDVRRRASNGRTIPRSWSCLRAPKATRAPRKAASRREIWDWRRRRSSQLSLRRRHAAHSGHAASTWPTSRLPRAATIPAPSASFPSCAASSVRAASNPSSPKPSAWPQGGVREITLIGQDTTCYGEDFGLKDGLALLLEKLAAIEDLRWVRFLYAYPNKITGKLLDTIAQHEKICSYMDVPLQHASASVLKRMKRGGGADVFLRSIDKMRRTVPDLTLRTSFIVGFPGETEKEFEELCDFVREAQFDWMGAFAYSDQEGAGAYALDKKLSPREIERRRKHLMGIQRQISKKKKKALVGREFDLLLEGESEETDLLLEGRTAMHAPEIDGKVFVNDFPEELTPQPGQFYRCQITEAHDYDLVAKIL